MLYLTCTMISSVDLAHYGVSRIKDWVSGDCGTSESNSVFVFSQSISRIYIFPFPTGNGIERLLIVDTANLLALQVLCCSWKLYPGIHLQTSSLHSELVVVHSLFVAQLVPM